jgi:hypothetical protein
MSGKHPKKHSPVPDAEPTTPSPSPASDVSAAELRAQMAILAEQVRRLGDRVGGTGDAWAAPLTPSPATQPVVAESPPPIGSAVVEPGAPPPGAHVVSLSLEHARPAAAAHHAPRPDLAAVPATEPAELTSRLMASVIEMAERAAQQIRESAEREAARIRAGATSDLPRADPPIPDPPAPQRCTPEPAPSQTGSEVLEHERQALAALAAETDRIEAAAERLRAQARALDAERQRLYEAIGAARRKA